jgi:putative tricarboxylic transport membrane protein
MTRTADGRIVGALLVLLGVLALREGRRLSVLRETLVAGAVVGDDTFPLIVGAALLVLGVYLLLAAPPPPVRVEFPRGDVRTRMLMGAGVLVAYWLLVPWLGYTGGTAIVSTALYRGMGGYRWPAAVLLGAVSTGVLYLLFRVWLLQPLPTGILGA